jgi:hypothetical protein
VEPGGPRALEHFGSVRVEARRIQVAVGVYH